MVWCCTRRWLDWCTGRILLSLQHQEMEATRHRDTIATVLICIAACSMCDGDLRCSTGAEHMATCRSSPEPLNGTNPVESTGHCYTIERFESALQRAACSIHGSLLGCQGDVPLFTGASWVPASSPPNPRASLTLRNAHSTKDRAHSRFECQSRIIRDTNRRDIVRLTRCCVSRTPWWGLIIILLPTAHSRLNQTLPDSGCNEFPVDGKFEGTGR